MGKITFIQLKFYHLESKIIQRVPVKIFSLVLKKTPNFLGFN